MQDKRFGQRPHRLDEDLLDDEYGDEYDEYGSQSQGQYYIGENAANAAMIEGSGGSDEYGEDLSDESGMMHQHYMQQLAANRAKELNKKGFGGIGGGKQGFLTGASAGGFGSQSGKPAGGGFAYGAAGGSLFGAASAAGPSTFQSGLSNVGALGGMGGGANLFADPPKQSTGGGFALGAASQFGGLGGSGQGLFGAAPIGDVAGDDPYDNIPLDLSKIKRTEKPTKTFEEKTKEEQEIDLKQTSKIGASIMKKPGSTQKNTKNITFGQCVIYEYDNNPETNAVPDRVDSKDISDMRDEKTKLRDQLQQQENEQLAQIKRMQELMRQKEQSQKKDEIESPEGSKFKSSASVSDKVEDSIGESASLTHSKKVTESYDTDTFEDNSGSASKNASDSKKGIQYWPGKNAVEISVSGASQSKDQSLSGGDVNQVLSGDAMEEYMKRKAAGPEKVVKKEKGRLAPDVSSSGGYTDEDFESMSKSQSHQLLSVKSRQEMAKFQKQQQSDIIQKYVKKENKFTMTEKSRYNFMSKDDTQPQSAKEWTLKRNLEDAEMLIQQYGHEIAELKEFEQSQDIRMKQIEIDYKSAKRETANSNATGERMKEQLKDYMHKINLYKIETEDLIKQIDLADAKTREKEDELHLIKADYDHKMKLQEERILMRRSKADERSQLEIRRQNQITVDELKNKIEERDEEIDYLKQKVEKLETENHQVRIGKGDNKRQRELENEVEMLKVQLEDVKYSGGQASMVQATSNNLDLRNVKKQLSPDEQVQLQKEIIQLDMILKGYMDENKKSMRRQKELEDKVKEQTEVLKQNDKKLKDYELKSLKERKGIFVEEDEDEVNIQAKNIMGASQSISKCQLEELYNTLKVLQSKADYAQINLNTQASQFKGQISKLRDEKAIAEKQLYDNEFQLGERDREYEKLEEQSSQNKQYNEEQIKELQAKITWFRENQKLLTEDEGNSQSTYKELNEMKLKLAKAKEDKKRLAELEKKCRLLEDTIKSKNPNSIGMLIQAAKTDVVRDGESESKRELEERIQQLQFQLETKDKEFEKKLRTMRQEQERIKALYEAKAGNSGDSKLVKQLEEELAKTKIYYNKRIREIEDKYKYGMGKKDSAFETIPKSGRSNLSERKQLAEKDNQLQELQERNEQLMKERNHLAQKVVDLEQSKQLDRRNSMQGSQAGASPKASNQDLKSVFYQQPDGDQSNQSPLKPPKPSKVNQQSPNLNPFSFSSQNDQIEKKSIPDILQIFSNLNFKAIFGNKMSPKINELYTIMTNDLGLSISVSDIKSLNKFLLNRQNQKEDVEFLDIDENVVDLKFLQSCLPNNGRSTDDDSSDLINQLKRENRSLKQQLQQDDTFALAQTSKLKGQLNDFESDKRDLQQKVNKLEAQKSRLESVFKSAMKGGNMDIIDEVQLLVRRIEFLEEQNDKRSKTTYMENQEPYLREIDMLRSKLQQEREIRESIIHKKNAEVSYFKSELDALLSEMQNQFKKKQARGVQ